MGCEKNLSPGNRGEIFLTRIGSRASTDVNRTSSNVITPSRIKLPIS